MSHFSERPLVAEFRVLHSRQQAVPRGPGRERGAVLDRQHSAVELRAGVRLGKERASALRSVPRRVPRGAPLVRAVAGGAVAARGR